MPAFSHTQHPRSHTNTEQQNRLPLGLRRSQRMCSHWPSPHGIHQASGLVPGQPGPGPTFLALETKSSLELQADHGEGLRATGHCSPGEQGGLADSAGGSTSVSSPYYPQGASARAVTLHSLLPSQAQGSFNLAPADLPASSSLFPRAFPHFGLCTCCSTAWNAKGFRDVRK